MVIVVEPTCQPLARADDPDDFRPDSELAIVVDPSDGDDGFCERLTVFYERIGEGDRIPVHQHAVEEVLFLAAGRIEARIGEERRVIGPGATVFIPARTSHGFENVGGMWPGSTSRSAQSRGEPSGARSPLGPSRVGGL